MKQYWSSASLITKIIIIAVAIIVAYLIYKLIAGYIKKRRDEALLANSTVTTNVGGQPISVNLGSVAQQIHGAFHDNDWFGASEDEELAIVTLTNVPKSLIPELKKIYFTLYQVNMNDEFVKYLSGSDYARVSNLLN